MSTDEKSILLKYIEQGFESVREDLKSNDNRLEKFEAYVHAELKQIREEDRARLRDLHLRIDSNQKEMLSHITVMAKTLTEVQFFMSETKRWMEHTRTDIESIKKELATKAEKIETEKRIVPLESFQMRMTLILTGFAAACAFAWDAIKEWYKR